MYESVNKHNHLLTGQQTQKRAPLVAHPGWRKRGRDFGPGAEIGAGSFPGGVMAEAALEAVRRALQEFPAAARGEWTLTGSSDRANSAEGAWGAGNSDYVCMSAGTVATHFRVYPSPAGGRVFSSRSHALLPSWGAVVVFKTQHSSDGSHSAILKASGVLSPVLCLAILSVRNTLTSHILGTRGF